MSLMNLTAVELGKKIKNKEVTVVEATKAALDAIDAKEDKVNSFVTVDREGALKRAEDVQKLRADGKLAQRDFLLHAVLKFLEILSLHLHLRQY